MIAHLLTGVRLLLVVPVAVTMARPAAMPPALLLLALVVAMATDYFDGPVARWRGTSSPAGQLADHATDFLFVTAGLTGVALAGHVPVALPVLIAVAFTQYVADSYWLYHDKQLRVSTLGRWNGMLYFVPLVVVAASRLDRAPGRGELWSTLLTVLGYGLVISTVASIIDRATAPRRARRRQE